MFKCYFLCNGRSKHEIQNATDSLRLRAYNKFMKILIMQLTIIVKMVIRKKNNITFPINFMIDFLRFYSFFNWISNEKELQLLYLTCYWIL